MVEIEGMLKDKLISILIDLGSILSYVLPRNVELCKLQQNKFENSWLVQLATGTNWKVTSFVNKCEFNINGFKMQDDLHIIPLGYYDLLIGMDSLEKHRVIMNCYDKPLSCIDE